MYQARRGSGRPTSRPSERLVIEPRQSTTVPKIEESISDKLIRQIKEEPKKQTGPEWKPRKVTKLPKVDKSQTPDSMLFRMYDKGKRPKRGGDEFAIGQPMDVDIGTSPTRFYETQVPAGTSKSLEKEILETIVVPESNIRKGEAINVRSRRRSSTKIADGSPPTSKSLQAEGEPRTVPTEIPSVGTGLSYEQKSAKFYREAFPQARSTREARKLYEQSMGREDIITTIGEYGPTGSPLGSKAKKTPFTTVSVPVKFKNVVNPQTGEITKKPIVFESRPAIETAAGPVELSKAPELKPFVTKEQEKASRKKAKAAKLKSQAQQAGRLRDRGIIGDEARSKYDEIQRIKAAGKKFQRRYDVS